MGFETMAAISLGVGAIGTGVSVISNIQQGRSQQQWYEYNAAVARQQAEQQRLAAEANAERMRINNEEALAKARLSFNISGATSAGTPMDLLADIARKQELDVNTYLYNQTIGANALQQQAGSQSVYGQQAAQAGMWGAGKSLLTGVSQAASIYSGYKTSDMYSTFLKQR